MEKAARHQLTKELGLEAGYRLVKFTTGSEYLHYGRFEPDIPPDYLHLKAAQDRYVDRLLALIPSGVKRILDVGAGSGKTAEVLIGKGYAVDCVSPGTALSSIVEGRLAGRGTVYRALFQEASIPGRYDLVLFSESFQYIPMAVALDKAIALLNPGGHILICDYFNLAPPGGTTFGGGHKYADWLNLYPRYPLEMVAEEDITAETAVVHDILHHANHELFLPLLENGRTAAAARWPFLTRLFLWLFRRPIDKAMKRRFASNRTGAEFIRSKIYKVYLFRLARDAKGPPG
jgi:SAM-dependent methyltransferase